MDFIFNIIFSTSFYFLTIYFPLFLFFFNTVLKDVQLTFAADRPCGKYSGGMKRRLSVANSLVGSPKVVYLDEPSTGLDPASRRTLWDCIVSAKGNDKSIVLTTHSMEEADALCDRLAIMARGKLRCIGKAAELKLRFGSGFTFTVSVNLTNCKNKMEQNAVQNNMHLYIMKMFPTASLLAEPIAGTSQYEVNRKDVVLSTVFSLMEDDAVKLKYLITDWAITETSLDQCFLKVARRVHAEEDGVVERMGRTLSTACRDEFGVGDNK